MPALSREAEVELARRWRDNHDRQAHDLLIMSQRGNVLFLANKYRSPGLELDDLIQAGWRGASRAAVDYDPERGIRFSTYSIYWIHAFISKTAKMARRHVVMTTSLEFPVFAQNEELTLGDTLPTDGREIIKSENHLAFCSYIKIWLRLLGKRERYIIKRRYLSKSLTPLEEIGQELNLTRERVRQIEALAIRKIRKYVTTGKLS